MSVESIEYNGIKYAEIIWADTRVEKTTFFSPPESSLTHRDVIKGREPGGVSFMMCPMGTNRRMPRGF